MPRSAVGSVGGVGERGEMIKYGELDRLEIHAFQDISEELAKDFAEPAKVRVGTMWNFMTDQIRLRVRQPIWGQGPFLGDPIEYPANWKEAIKERFAPRWLKHLWPVRKTVKRFEARILYPKISFPKEDWRLSVDVSDVATD